MVQHHHRLVIKHVFAYRHFLEAFSSLDEAHYGPSSSTMSTGQKSQPLILTVSLSSAIVNPFPFYSNNIPGLISCEYPILAKYCLFLPKSLLSVIELSKSVVQMCREEPLVPLLFSSFLQPCLVHAKQYG
jgi:hypothetical protein